MTINTLTKHRDEKILILSSSVVCLSLTILKIFEKKKGIIRPRKKKTNVSCPCSLHFLGPPLFFYYFLLVLFFLLGFKILVYRLSAIDINPTDVIGFAIITGR